MKFFIDSASISEIEQAATYGFVDGVTTNPSLVSKQSMPFEELLKRICELIKGPVSAEVTTNDADEMVEQGKKLAQINDQIVIKLPLNLAGLQATRRLTGEGIQTNVTLCFTPNQALLAAKAGATYISPFVGRLDDISTAGMQLISEIKTIYSNYNLTTQILVASIRHPLHLQEAALIGAHVATLPFKVMTQLLKHPLTDSGLDQFLKDWQAKGHA